MLRGCLTGIHLMKYFVLIFLITTLILKAQVFESGFGSSAILSVKRGGADANNDGIYDFSDINLLGKKVFDQSSGEYDSYYQIPNDENLFFPQSVETSDLNGDGVDEIITFSLGNDENPTLFINAFKGDDGEPLFSKSFTTSSVNSSSPFFNIAADFTGDGKGEPGVLFFRREMANENSSPYPVFVLLDQAGNSTLDYSLESFSIKEGYRISKLYPGDFNGDQYDDFFFLVSIEDELVDGLYSHKMILFDGASLSFNEINPTFFRDKKYTIPVISIGQFSGKSSDEIIFICSEIPKTYQITKFRMAVVDISVSEERIFNLSQFFPNVNFALPQFAVNAALTEENHSVLVSLRTGNDFNGDNLPDQFTFAGINTKTNTILFTKTNNLTANSHITSIIPADFNGDNLDEILTVNKAYGDLDNDGIPDGSQITLYTRTGSEIYTKNSVSIGLNDVSLDDELYDIVPCKLDSDVLTDVAMVFRYGDDTNNDGVKDGSLLCYFEPVTSSLIESHISIATDGFSKKIEKILPVNNDITEQELLRMIDLSSQDLSEVKSYFLSNTHFLFQQTDSEMKIVSLIYEMSYFEIFSVIFTEIL